MLTNTFYGNSATRQTRKAQREATKASEGLQRVLELANRGEPVASEKSVKALDYAIVKVGILKSRTVKYGELRNVKEELEKVVEEKEKKKSKRVDDLTRQIGLVNQQIDQLLMERETFSGQIIAANAVCNGEESQVEGRHTWESARHSDADNQRHKSAVISDYCNGDWDDSVDDDFTDE